jgi:hypothetical protein
MAEHAPQKQTHYDLLGIKPTASPQAIRRAYRDLSKLYHPDTTELAPAIATAKFQALNEAYAVLSSPEKRLAYDYSVGYSRLAVIQAPAYLNRPASERSRYERSSAYLDPTDRPLSAGELFALFILGVTFVCCLMLVVARGFTQGAIALPIPIPAALEQGMPRAPLTSPESALESPDSSAPAIPLNPNLPAAALPDLTPSSPEGRVGDTSQIPATDPALPVSSPGDDDAPELPFLDEMSTDVSHAPVRPIL